MGEAPRAGAWGQLWCGALSQCFGIAKWGLSQGDAARLSICGCRPWLLSVMAAGLSWDQSEPVDAR